MKRANKKYADRALKETGEGVHTLCGCVIPWPTRHGSFAATYAPKAVDPKPVCPACEAFVTLLTDTTHAVDELQPINI